MKPETLKLLDRRLDRVQKEHIDCLLSLLNDSLQVIKVGRKATISESLELFKQATAAAQAMYGVAIRTEVLLVVNQTQYVLDAEGKVAILALTSKYFSENLYMERFRAYEESFARHVSRYSARINLADFRPDLVKALYHVGSVNFIRSTMAHLADDLELIVQRPAAAVSALATPVATPEGKMEQANRFVKLEPNFLGIGLNLNYLIRRWLGKKE